MSATQALPDLSRSNADSPLLRLPQELLIRVASYVTTPELGHLRISCKDVEARLFESFAYEFFHKRQFMVEEPSLQALIDISNHPTLSKRLTEVIISTTQYHGAADNSRSSTAQELFASGYAMHSTLVASGQARDMLVEAFRNLPSLRKVGLRDYDAQGRYRDGEKALWRSYGHSFPTNKVVLQGSPFDALKPSAYLPEDAWTLLLQAIGVSGVMVPSVEVFLRHACRLSDRAFDVLSGRMSKNVVPLLAQLQTLMLTVGSEKYGVQLSNPQHRDIRLKKFLHHTPALERLRLNFDEHTNDLLDWLAASPKSSNNAKSSAQLTLDDYALPVSFPHLTTLDLGMVRVDPTTLLKALTRFELKSFNLWRVVLTVDSRTNIKPAADEPNVATKFIEKLGNAKLTQQVQYAMVGYLKVNGKSDPRHRAYDVNFPPAVIGSLASGNSADGNSARTRSGKSNGSASSPPKKVEHQVISFNIGGLAPNFAAWAKEMAGRATIVKQHRGFEIPDISDGEDDLDDSELDEDMDDEDDEMEDEDEDEDEDDE